MDFLAPVAVVHTTMKTVVENAVANLNAAESVEATKPPRATVPSNRFLKRIFSFHVPCRGFRHGLFCVHIHLPIKQVPIGFP